jgi:hypothetical protein
MNAEPRLSKQAVERRTFEALAPLIGWDVVPGSLRQPDPPQPDILCEVVGRGPVAVELVSLDAEDMRLRLSNMFHTRDAWGLALSRWAPDARQRLLTDLTKAYISVNFAEELGTRDRATIFGVVQDFLLARPGFRGEIAAEIIGTPPGFHAARVGRFNHFADGPHISAPSAGYWQAPQIENIVRKLSDRQYTPAAPMELFAYSTHDEPDGAVGSLEGIRAAIAQHLPGSHFERVHLFHVGFLTHICSMP